MLLWTTYFNLQGANVMDLSVVPRQMVAKTVAKHLNKSRMNDYSYTKKNYLDLFSSTNIQI